MRLGRIQQSPHRIELFFEDPSMSDLVMLGRYNYTRAQALGLSPHAHADTMEICYLAKGKQVYRVAGHDYTLTGGDVFVAFPDESHSTGGTPEEKGILYWLQLRIPRQRTRFLSSSGREARTFLDHLLTLRTRHFRGMPSMKVALDGIIDVFQRENFPLQKIVIRSKVMEFLLQLIECANRHLSTRLSRPLETIMQHIEANLSEPMAIHQLAARAGLSPSRFKIRFKSEVGIPPAEFILRRKIDRAKTMLTRDNMNVTRVAFELGFSSSQYFATVFKRYTGRNPSRALPAS